MRAPVVSFIVGFATAAAIAAGFAGTLLDMQERPTNRALRTTAVKTVTPAVAEAPQRPAPAPTTSGLALPVLPAEETIDMHAPPTAEAKLAAEKLAAEKAAQKAAQEAKANEERRKAAAAKAKRKRAAQRREAQRARARASSADGPYYAQDYQQPRNGFFGWR